MKYINSIYSRVAMIVILSLVHPWSFAEVYKWVDKDGNTVYSQSKPAGSVKYETVGTPSKVDSARALKKLRDDKIKSQKYLRQRLEKQSKKRKSAEDIENSKKNCDQARESLAGLQRPRISIPQPDGSYVRLSEEERQKQIRKAQEQIREWCD